MKLVAGSSVSQLTVTESISMFVMATPVISGGTVSVLSIIRTPPPPAGGAGGSSEPVVKLRKVISTVTPPFTRSERTR